MNKIVQENVADRAEHYNLRSKIKEFLPNFETYCDHMAVLQNKNKIPMPVDKSLDSSTQTEPRNCQSDHFRKLFEQDWEQLMSKVNVDKSPYDFDKEDYERQIRDLENKLQ